MNNDLIFAKKLALQAGDIMLQHFHHNVDQHIKEDQTIVTIADEQINSFVVQEVNKAYPDHSILGEEESDIKKSEYVWVCDPIDGTVPYAKGLPVSVFSLALVQDGVPIIGVVYDPFTKRLYSAVKNEGAYLNNTRINVSKKSLERQATVNVEWWSEAEYDIETPLHSISLQTATYVLHLGCVINAACLVASGQYEACIFAGTKGKAVDIAAVKIIVEEAGGKVTNLFGEEQRYDTDIKGAIVSNGVVHEEIVDALRTYVK